VTGSKLILTEQQQQQHQKTKIYERYPTIRLFHEMARGVSAIKFVGLIEVKCARNVH
jgi:hypothetical protein